MNWLPCEKSRVTSALEPVSVNGCARSFVLCTLTWKVAVPVPSSSRACPSSLRSATGGSDYRRLPDRFGRASGKRGGTGAGALPD